MLEILALFVGENPFCSDEEVLGKRMTDDNEILNVFRLFDDDGTGMISFKNLKRVAKELGVRMTDKEHAHFHEHHHDHLRLLLYR